MVLFSDTHFIIHRPLKVLMRIREKNISSLILIQRIVLKFRVSRVTVNIYSHISNMQLSSDLHNLHTVCPYTNMTKDRGGSSDLHNLHKHTMCPYTNMTKDKGGSSDLHNLHKHTMCP